MATTPHRVLAAYHQVHLAPSGLSPVLDSYPESGTGLAQVADGGRSLVLLTSISMGPVTVHIGKDGPGALPGEWEDTVVLSLDLTTDLYLTAPTLFDAGPPGPVHTPRRPGRHTVTVLGRGRRADRYDDVLDPDDEPFEEYAVLFEH